MTRGTKSGLICSSGYFIVSILISGFVGLHQISADKCYECAAGTDGKVGVIQCRTASGEGKRLCKLVEETNEETGNTRIVCKLSGDDCSGDSVEMF